MTDEMEWPDKPRVLGMLNTIAWIIDQAEKTGYITEQEKREYFKVNRMVITRIGNTKIEHEKDNPVAPPEETEKQRIEGERTTEYIQRKGDRMDEQKAKDIVSLMNFEAMKMMAGFHMLRTSGMKFTGLAFRDQNEGCKYVVHVDIDTEEVEE